MVRLNSKFQFRIITRVKPIKKYWYKLAHTFSKLDHFNGTLENYNKNETV
jgi:hypothetical protein